MRGDEVRGEARLRVPQDAHGEEQEVRRGAAHHREVPGAIQAALLHPPHQVRTIPSPLPHLSVPSEYL